MKNTGTLAGYTLFITGASRGIGKSIALKAAKDEANIVIAAKTAQPHPKLPGTIYTAAKEIEDAGGKCLPCVVDVRDEKMVKAAVEEAVKTFGGIDILVNNASAISLTGTESTSMKTYDLMNQINARGTYLCSKTCIPYLLKSKERGRNPHILNISPPLSMNPVWFQNHAAYTMAKYGMSMCVLGMAAEFEERGVSVNALWPRTSILTAAVANLSGKEAGLQSRKPDIMADAAYAVLKKDISCTGNFLIDDDVLAAEGITNLDQYAVEPGNKLRTDIFLEEPHMQPNSQSEEVLQEGFQADESASVSAIFQDVEKNLTPSLVAEVGGVFKFKLTGDSKIDTWMLDLKNGGGRVSHSDGNADCIMTMSTEDFTRMFQGKLNPSSAFLGGKMKIGGNIMLSMKLEKLMKSIPKAKL